MQPKESRKGDDSYERNGGNPYAQDPWPGERYRARIEALRLSCHAAGSLLLLTGAILLLRDVQSPGVASVADGYGAVLLRDGAGAYVVVGLLTFALGVLATLLCVRMKNSAAKRMQIDDEKWN